jgi:hypothetical protein
MRRRQGDGLAMYAARHATSLARCGASRHAGGKPEDDEGEERLNEGRAAAHV